MEKVILDFKGNWVTTKWKWMRLYSVEDAQWTKRASDQLGSDPLKHEGRVAWVSAVWFLPSGGLVGWRMHSRWQRVCSLLCLLTTYHSLSLFSWPWPWDWMAMTLLSLVTAGTVRKLWQFDCHSVVSQPHYPLLYTVVVVCYPFDKGTSVNSCSEVS